MSCTAPSLVRANTGYVPEYTKPRPPIGSDEYLKEGGERLQQLQDDGLTLDNAILRMRSEGWDISWSEGPKADVVTSPVAEEETPQEEPIEPVREITHDDILAKIAEQAAREKLAESRIDLNKIIENLNKRKKEDRHTE
jgi:hypothetical protein